VRVDLGDRLETMTLTVVVAVREFGIARAKDIARRFAELSTT
jgi:hypothetical protein